MSHKTTYKRFQVTKRQLANRQSLTYTVASKPGSGTTIDVTISA